jgi:hypothetical protein
MSQLLKCLFNNKIAFNIIKFLASIAQFSKYYAYDFQNTCSGMLRGLTIFNEQTIGC